MGWAMFTGSSQSGPFLPMSLLGAGGLPHLLHIWGLRCCGAAQFSVMEGKGVDLGNCPAAASGPQLLLAGWPRSNSLTFLRLSFLIWKMLATPCMLQWRINVIMWTSSREHRAWRGIGRCSATVTLFSFLMDRVVVNLYLIGETHSRLIRMS